MESKEEHKSINTYADYRNVHNKEIEELRNSLNYLLKSDMELMRKKLEKFLKRKDQTLLRILNGKGKIKVDKNMLDRDLYEYKLLFEVLKAGDKIWQENKDVMIKELEENEEIIK